jgi:hypothetical protein
MRTGVKVRTPAKARFSFAAMESGSDPLAPPSCLKIPGWGAFAGTIPFVGRKVAFSALWIGFGFCKRYWFSGLPASWNPSSRCNVAVRTGGTVVYVDQCQNANLVKIPCCSVVVESRGHRATPQPPSTQEELMPISCTVVVQILHVVVATG